MKRNFLLVVLFFAAGCSSIIPTDRDAAEVTPTTHPLFILPSTTVGEEGETAVSDGTPAATEAAGSADQLATVTPTLLPTVEPVPLPAEGSVAIEPIYDDSLSTEWRLYRIDDIDVNLEYTNRSHGGSSSISILAPSRNGRILFTFQENSETAYHWDEVVGLSFWIRSDDIQVPPSAIYIGVLGSDEAAYWRTSDRVTYSDSDLPIETNLMAWGIERSIPSNSWMEVTVELNALMQNESFEWFTGFYLRSETGPSEAIFIDDVNLIVFVKDE